MRLVADENVEKEIVDGLRADGHDVIFIAEDEGKLVVDLVDPHGWHLADALPKLQGLALYAESHSSSFFKHP